MADRFQISMMTPSKGRDYITISIPIFVQCGKYRVFSNPVTYTALYLSCPDGELALYGEAWVHGLRYMGAADHYVKM